MAQVELVYDPLPQPALERFVVENLISLNTARTGLSGWHPANFFLRNAQGEWLGGLLGFVWGRWLQVRILWVSETLRGQGHGTRLLQAAEAFAREHGAVAVTLETYSFQAPDFYRRLGYAEIGRLKDYPPGHDKLVLMKQL